MLMLMRRKRNLHPFYVCDRRIAYFDFALSFTFRFSFEVGKARKSKIRTGSCSRCSE